MSVLIEDCKGFVHVFGKGGGSGFYKVEPEIGGGGEGKCLIMGIPIQSQEIVQPTVTLDDKRILYTFGSAWSESSVAGLLLLGPDSGGGAILGQLLSWYETNRVSKKKGPVGLSLGSGQKEAYVTGLRLDAADPAFNKQAFSIILLLPE